MYFCSTISDRRSYLAILVQSLALTVNGVCWLRRWLDMATLASLQQARVTKQLPAEQI
jgi:hypothetical protein